jgi:protein-S-isoprenylcysteine O-methyltransferase Ste14
VLWDERRLEQAFGADYVDYKSRVKRWIPFVF